MYSPRGLQADQQSSCLELQIRDLFWDVRTKGRLFVAWISPLYVYKGTGTITRGAYNIIGTILAVSEEEAMGMQYDTECVSVLAINIKLY